MTRWPVSFTREREALRALHEVWVAARVWKAHFERFHASARDMLHLEGAFRRMEAFTSPELVKALRSLEG